MIGAWFIWLWFVTCDLRSSMVSCSMKRIRDGSSLFIARAFMRSKYWSIHARALSVSSRRPTVLIIWHRHSRSSPMEPGVVLISDDDAPLPDRDLRRLLASRVWIHLCKMPSCNSSSLPNSPMNLMFPSILCFATTNCSSSSGVRGPSFWSNTEKQNTKLLTELCFWWSTETHKGWMDGWTGFRPLFCTIKAELGRGQPGLMRWSWDETLPQSSIDRSTLDSAAHRTTSELAAAPETHKGSHLWPNTKTRNTTNYCGGHLSSESKANRI